MQYAEIKIKTACKGDQHRINSFLSGLSSCRATSAGRVWPNYSLVRSAAVNGTARTPAGHVWSNYNLVRTAAVNGTARTPGFRVWSK